jgi:hypothetical protein
MADSNLLKDGTPKEGENIYNLHKMSRTLNCMGWNARSLCSREKCDFFNWLLLQHDPDVFIVVEAWGETR